MQKVVKRLEKECDKYNWDTNQIYANMDEVMFSKMKSKHNLQTFSEKVQIW